MPLSALKLFPLVLGLALAGPQPARTEESAVPDPAPPAAAPYPQEAPAFTLAPREHPIKDFPCTRCHRANKPADPTPRRLRVRHPQLNHGDGRFWCMTCHHPEEHNQLTMLTGQPVAFEDAHQVCGQCHTAQHKDWYFGVHGKRLSRWQGSREIYNCTHCHNPHEPAIEPRPPLPPPTVRSGLEQDNVSRGRTLEPIWERYLGTPPIAPPPFPVTRESPDVRD